MPVTLRDIAKRLNVSKQAVSVALNQRASSTKLSPHLCELIRRTAEEMGYRPHLGALALNKKRTGLFTIACRALRDPHYAEAIQAAEDAVNAAGMIMCVLNPKGAQARTDSRLYLMSDAVLYLAGIGPEDFPIPPESVEIPCVLVRPGDPPEVPIPHYHWADIEGSEAIARHLSERGHRRVAVLAGARQSTLTLKTSRVLNILNKLSEVGIEGLPIWSEDERNMIRLGGELMEQVLKTHPDVTAVIGRNDRLTLGAYLWCVRTGVAVPERISLLSHVDSVLLESVLPAITAVRTPMRDATVYAVRSLLAHLRDGIPLESDRAWHPTLVVRESVSTIRSRLSSN